MKRPKTEQISGQDVLKMTGELTWARKTQANAWARKNEPFSEEPIFSKHESRTG